ncbi:MAG: hypothetical protein EXS13_10140 [Planctomycetes bacterium]|nr:hypothetical protein [Planctomycetota bacterium]
MPRVLVLLLAATATIFFAPMLEPTSSAAASALAPVDSVTLDFAKQQLPDGWSLSSKAWKVEGGELRGVSDGMFEFAGPIADDFKLSFRAETSEKANVEVKLYDAESGTELYTFAFLGRWHSVLDGVKCCMLRGGNFVAVDSKMWIFPGRRFTFEVRRAKGQMQMFLDGVLGPLFVDPQPLIAAKGIKLRVLVSTEGSKDKVVIDDVTLEHAKP